MAQHQHPTSSKMQNPPSISISSSSTSFPIKLVLLTVLALLFLNLNASSVIVNLGPSSSKSNSKALRQHHKKKQQASLPLSSLRTNNNKSNKKKLLQPKNDKIMKQQHIYQQYQSSSWKVVEQYESFEDQQLEDLNAVDSIDIDSEDGYSQHQQQEGGVVHDVSSSITNEEKDVAALVLADENDEVDDDDESRQNKNKVGYNNMIIEDEKLMKDIQEGKRGEKKKGKIAWLMSFPNSGTSFTSLLIRHASNATTATNYGMESNLGLDGKSVPVYDWSVEGPYWLHPPQQIEKENNDDATTKKKYEKDDYQSGTKLGKSGEYSTPHASSSIMTKTHCGSRCAFCPPQKYLETPTSFLRQCLSGSRKVPAADDNKQQKGKKKQQQQQYKKLYSTYYHPSIVERAVHLIRNPFDNLVSRFHHEQKEHKKKDSTKWLNRYSNDVTGFKKWCADEDKLYAKDEQLQQQQHTIWKDYGYDKNDITNYFEGVSCHGELFRYVQWHILALQSIEMLEIPVLYVYYEDYSRDLKASTEEMLEFLHLDRKGDLPKFDSNKDYSGYFTREERAAASDFMRRVAAARGSERGKKLLERYWVTLDFDKLKKETKSIK